jgi:hypothetical protein
MTRQRGIALILVLLVTSFLSAVGLGLAVMVFMDRLATGNVRGSVALLHAADAGLELAAHGLARADWGEVLAGREQSSFSDGAPSGVRDLPGGGAVNLTAETNTLNCGRTTACSNAQMEANSDERPWGPNNPRWRLYAYGPLDHLAAIVRPTPCYLAVWVADDWRERDGDPVTDGAEAGRGVLRVRAGAYGPLGSRRAVEAELARVCFAVAGEEWCQPGIRVQSWQEVRQLVP